MATKTTSNTCLAPLIQRAAARGARVLLLQNGLSVEDALRPSLSEDLHLLGGLCFVSAHRGSAGEIEHMAGDALTLGYHSGPGDKEAAQRVLAEAVALFVATGIGVEAKEDLDGARWHKLLLDAPVNGLSVLLNSGTLAMMSHVQTRALLRELMEEVVAGAAACGHPLPAGSLEEAWAGIDVKADYQPSMLLDFAAGRPLELDAIYAAPLSAVAKVGFAMPKVPHTLSMPALSGRPQVRTGFTQCQEGHILNGA